MKCVQCSHEFSSGVKFCPECGAKQDLKCGACGSALTPGIKFCPECGAKADANGGAAAAAAGVVSRIDLAPSPLGLADCPVTIQEVCAEGPNGDGELRITVKYQITNDTDDDWDYFEVQTKLLSAAGQIVEVSNDTQEQTISAGESAEFESSFWGIKQKALGSSPEQAHIVISALACGFSQQKLGEVSIPETAFEPVALAPAKIGEVAQLVSGSLWKTEPGDDKESQVEVKALVQNLTAHHLPAVKLVAEITDKSDRDVADAGGSGAVKPGALSAISGSGWGKDKQFKGAKAALSLRAYWPVAAGMSQHQGMTITAGDSPDEHESSDSMDGWPFKNGGESESESEQGHGRLIDVRIGVVREDWDPEEFGDEISFWSRDNPQIFAIDGEPVEDYAIEALSVMVLFRDGEITVAATKHGESTNLMSFTADDSGEDDTFGGAREFLAVVIAAIADRTVAEDAAWLILNNGRDAIADDGWATEVASDWFCESGGGDQLHATELKYAGGLFIDAVSYDDMAVQVSDGEMDYDSDDADEKRVESSRFVGVGVAKSEVEANAQVEVEPLPEIMARIEQLQDEMRLDDASQLGRDALVQHQDSVELLTSVAMTDFVRGDYAGAAMYYKRALLLDPENRMLNTRLGRVLVSLGLTTNDSAVLEESAKTLTKAVKLEPDNVEAWTALGLLFSKTNAPDMARQAYQRVLALNPNDDIAKKALADFERAAAKDQSDRFSAAVADSKNLPRPPDNDTLLKMYGLYKQATEGDVTGDRPGFMDRVGRSKYDAWGAIKGTSGKAAMQQYIDLVASLKG